jgi:hypothetical protein
MNFEQLSAPILLSADVTVGTGLTAIADTGLLSTKFRRPFVIKEVRWAVQAARTVGETNRVQTKLSMGRIQISDRFLPLENYAPLLTERVESWGDDSGLWSNYRWKLPTPLYVPPGMTLKSEFFRLAGLAPISVNVNVAYSGHYVSEKSPEPAEIEVPWVSSFAPPDGVTFAQSSERDLYNPFLVPLKVQRMLFYTNIVEYPEREIPELTTVIKDSAGQNVVRDFTRHASVWDSNRRAWTVNRILPPKERYNVTLSLATGGIVSNLNGMVLSLMGSRKERMK